MLKVIHFNIFCLDAFPWLHGHVSQNAFTGFPITVENKTGDGNMRVKWEHTVPTCVCVCAGEGIGVGVCLGCVVGAILSFLLPATR